MEQGLLFDFPQFKITKKMLKKFKKGKKVKYTVIYRSAKFTRYVKIVK